jgi:two-component system cell cycle response regulator
VTEAQASVLVVDDDSVNRMLLARTLERDGHRVSTATNGRQALELLRSQPVDVVLLDVVMPEMDGCETLARIQGDSRLRHIPVVMVSALDEVETVVRCIEMGAEDYLPKPFDPVILRARLTGCLTRKRLHDLEREYIEQVGHVAAAAAAVEAGSFVPERLAPVARRDDALGRLARVFTRMALEVRAREQRLRHEVDQLRIEIDEARAARQIAEITETEYFRELEGKVDRLRMRPQRDRE